VAFCGGDNEALRFVYYKDIVFCLGFHFVLEALRFVYYKDIAFCADCVLSDNQMHNNIMAAGSRDRSPIKRRCPQWRSRFLRCVDTRPNGDALRKCILSGPYKPTIVLVQAVAATDDSPAIPEHTTPEWSRFVKIVKQQHKLDEVSYHKLFDI
nr:hypothetical protein [Tanacetum cinerariifolium]